MGNSAEKFQLTARCCCRGTSRCACSPGRSGRGPHTPSSGTWVLPTPARKRRIHSLGCRCRRSGTRTSSCSPNRSGRTCTAPDTGKWHNGGESRNNEIIHPRRIKSGFKSSPYPLGIRANTCTCHWRGRREPRCSSRTDPCSWGHRTQEDKGWRIPDPGSGTTDEYRLEWLPPSNFGRTPTAPLPIHTHPHTHAPKHHCTRPHIHHPAPSALSTLYASYRPSFGTVALPVGWVAGAAVLAQAGVLALGAMSPRRTGLITTVRRKEKCLVLSGGRKGPGQRVWKLLHRLTNFNETVKIPVKVT